ncbi:NnrU family protein [Amaricoccus solimangrovi]|uniref:NnrU domain-containing protein n=1 Tax=Amaricoccus solimangrovi TaxID=2589815 RepID=A0A501WIK8_9RHOB|nr:NnrU family protein [Amaricoccus solimangrovi]TPE49723.1 hypothetical protein FJM51_13855 [Amaricoccus solimangrovi]
MALLVLGLVLWTAPHLVKRLAPGARAGLVARLGEGGTKGLIGLVIGLGLVLIIIGFRSAPYVALYTPPAWAIHVNNTLMLIAVFLFGASHAPSRVKAWLRNPMLTGVVVWAVAHLLVNGDLAALILFGGMGLWAVANILAIDATAPKAPAGPVPVMADVKLAVIAVIVFAVIAAIHTWLGYWPFPR